MPLREEFESSGNWFFRWRSFIPFALLVPFCIAVLSFKWPSHLHDWQPLWQFFCLAVSLSGLLIRAAVVGYTPVGTSGRNTIRQIAESLNTTGLYSIVRHPLYLGNFLMWLGFGLVTPVWWLLAIYILSFWLYYERIMFAEEEFLRRKFGRQFCDWAEKTPAFIPRFSNWQPPQLSFSWRIVLCREYSGLFGICIGFLLIEEAEHFILPDFGPVHPFWFAFASIGAAIYLLLRTLKKHTAALTVAGR